MKTQIKILLNAAQWELKEANDNYECDSDIENYWRLRCLEDLVESLNECYKNAVNLEGK